MATLQDRKISGTANTVTTFLRAKHIAQIKCYDCFFAGGEVKNESTTPDSTEGARTHLPVAGKCMGTTEDDQEAHETSRTSIRGAIEKGLIPVHEEEEKVCQFDGQDENRARTTKSERLPEDARLHHTREKAQRHHETAKSQRETPDSCEQAQHVRYAHAQAVTTANTWTSIELEVPKASAKVIPSSISDCLQLCPSLSRSVSVYVSPFR